MLFCFCVANLYQDFAIMWKHGFLWSQVALWSGIRECLKSSLPGTFPPVGKHTHTHSDHKWTGACVGFLSKVLLESISSPKHSWRLLVHIRPKSPSVLLPVSDGHIGQEAKGRLIEHQNVSYRMTGRVNKEGNKNAGTVNGEKSSPLWKTFLPELVKPFPMWCSEILKSILHANAQSICSKAHQTLWLLFTGNFQDALSSQQFCGSEGGQLQQGWWPEQWPQLTDLCIVSMMVQGSHQYPCSRPSISVIHVLSTIL